MNCAVNKPYPSTETCCCNPCYAKLLSKDFCGPNGEMTAITQYLYQHFILQSCYPQTADLLECIARVEMTHFSLVGELIVNLGGDPKIGFCQGSTFNYWTGRYVDYQKCVENILEDDIKAEKAAIAAYCERKCQICDQTVCAVLDRIIADEKMHIQLFEDELKRICCMH